MPLCRWCRWLPRWWRSLPCRPPTASTRYAFKPTTLWFSVMNLPHHRLFSSWHSPAFLLHPSSLFLTILCPLLACVPPPLQIVQHVTEVVGHGTKLSSSFGLQLTNEVGKAQSSRTYTLNLCVFSSIFFTTLSPSLCPQVVKVQGRYLNAPKICIGDGKGKQLEEQVRGHTEIFYI